MRWVTFGIALVAVFLVSVGVGAFIARQRGPEPVANVATPTPGVTAVIIASASSAPATNPPTLPPPSAAPPTPAVARTPTLAPATQLPVVPAERFARDLLGALQTGDTTFLFGHLHPAVFERYGEGQCRRRVNGFSADPSASWTVVSSSGPAAWDWVSDDARTTVPDTWTVTVDEPSTGKRDLHFAEFDGEWKWFLDCGNPK